jgi:hypothetical protein
LGFRKLGDRHFGPFAEAQLRAEGVEVRKMLDERIEVPALDRQRHAAHPSAGSAI